MSNEEKKRALKDLLKPPFRAKGGYIFDADNNRVLEASMWQCIHGNKIPVSRFAAAAMNEKADRDFGEPLPLKKDIGYHVCEKCKKVFNDELYSKVFADAGFKFCPHCGQQLKKENQ
jgi:uncharacterized protein (UPF0212 family)